MEPIVSPWLIYGIEMLTLLKSVAIMIAFFSAILWIITVLIDEGFNGAHKVFIRRLSISFAITMVILVFVPTRATAYKMLMASYVTPNNIHTVGREANEAVSVLLDNITNHMKELKDNK